MKCRHVDIIAIAILLLGMALYSVTSAKPVPVVISHQGFRINKPFPRPLVVTPKPPRLPFTF